MMEMGGEEYNGLNKCLKELFEWTMLAFVFIVDFYSMQDSWVF